MDLRRINGAVSTLNPQEPAMKAFIQPIVTALLLATASSAFAQGDVPAPQRIEIVAPADKVAAARVVMERREQDLRFDMSNGRVFTVDSFGETLQLRYRAKRHLVRHDGQGGFVSNDGQLRVEFKLDPSGEPNKLSVSLPATWL